MSDGRNDEEALVSDSRGDRAFDVAAMLASAVPWLGGPVSQILSGIATGRKIGRVTEFVNGLAHDLNDFKSEASEQYVRTEDFQDLFERAAKAVFDERSEEKRRLFRALLVRAIQSPGTPYDEQARYLEALQRLQEAHIRVIRAVLQPPDPNPGSFGSPGQTLAHRLPDVTREQVPELVGELNAMGITKLTSLTTMMTGHGAADLRHGLTPFGRRFVDYVLR